MNHWLAVSIATMGERVIDEETEVEDDFSGFNWSSVASFAGSCAVNLVLPFVNGLMLGFGELLAHELAWRNHWFDRIRNVGFRVYPQRRLAAVRDAGQFL